ncbi:transcriptional regulator [Wenjunlia tyrosinilytica]|uniref:Transcriptional regulator n=1 Tax=Wenjunlia tyrosinilytica TaxID=1544741 RepID=A0A917ZHE3_9ACTN|nr:transcriptional regulator [Wenjunlia tyrosinilytica]
MEKDGGGVSAADEGPGTAGHGDPVAAGHEADPPDRLAPVLRPVRAGNGFEEALEQILQIVRLGLVPSGERLPSERELAERLRISRVTLREVLKVLQEQGLVESRRGRYGGTFVCRRTDPEGLAGGDAEAQLRRVVAQMGAEGIEDVLRFREVLELGAVELCAASDLSKAQERMLTEALAATGEAPLSDYRRLDTRLHLAVAELSGSPSVATHYAAVRAKVNELLDRIPLLVRNLEHSQRQHTAMVEAILDGDVDAAREVAREHVAGTAALLRGFLA